MRFAAAGLLWISVLAMACHADNMISAPANDRIIRYNTSSGYSDLATWTEVDTNTASCPAMKLKVTRRPLDYVTFRVATSNLTVFGSLTGNFATVQGTFDGEPWALTDRSLATADCNEGILFQRDGLEFTEHQLVIYFVTRQNETLASEMDGSMAIKGLRFAVPGPGGGPGGPGHGDFPFHEDSPSSDSEAGDNTRRKVLIIGTSVGLSALAILVVALVFLWRRRKQRRRRLANGQHSTDTEMRLVESRARVASGSSHHSSRSVADSTPRQSVELVPPYNAPPTPVTPVAPAHVR